MNFNTPNKNKKKETVNAEHCSLFVDFLTNLKLLT